MVNGYRSPTPTCQLRLAFVPGFLLFLPLYYQYGVNGAGMGKCGGSGSGPGG